MKAVSLTFTALMLLAPLTAFADDPATPPTPTPTPGNTKPADDPDRIVCKMEHPTGSILPKRVCHTAREWDQMTRDAHDSVEHAQRPPAQPH